MGHSRILLSQLLMLLSAFAVTNAQTSSLQPAVVPSLVSYSEVLRDASGRVVTGITGVTFLIYKDREGGAPLWLETQSIKPDASGHYTAQLGSASAHGLPSEVFMSGEGRWLAVRIGSEAEQPRVLLVAVPYAMKAADAETIGGLPPSAFVLATSQTVKPAATAAEVSATSAPPANAAVTGVGTVNSIPLWDTTSDIISSILSQAGTGTTAKIGINNTAPTSTLDVKGSATVRGTLTLPPTSAATATAGKASQPLNFIGSSFNSGTATAVNQTFRLQTEPVGNNTTTTSGTLSLLYATGTGAATETGLKIASNGQITFASGQLFPGTGSGTITGVTAGSGLIGGGTSGNISLSLPTTCATSQILKWTGSAWACGADSNSGGTITGVTAGTALTGGGTTGTVTLNLDTTRVPQLNTANTFTGNQTVSGNLSATGVVTGSSFQIGSALFAFGSVANEEAFLGFSGNSTSTGTENTAVGVDALRSVGIGSVNTAVGANALAVNTGYSNTAVGASSLELNTTGGSNSAVGSGALASNTTGTSNAAIGISAMQSNTTGSGNTGLGPNALEYNTTGSNNIGIGFLAGPDQAHPNLTNTIAIGNNAVVTASNSMVLGANGVNVGIGTSAPAFALDVHGTGNFTGPVTFVSGQTFPGTGTITGVTAGTGLTGGGTSGGVTLNVDTTKVVTGITAGAGLTGGGTGGVQTLNIDATKVAQLTTGNTFNGDQTVFGNINSLGVVFAASYNVGGGTLAFGSASSNDVFLGFAGTSAVAGNFNTGVGSLALGVGVTGDNNTAVGGRAMHNTLAGSHNTGVGAFALSEIESSNNSTAVGDSALWSAEGSGNTAIGANAGEPTNGFINTGSNNTFLGLNTTPGTQLALTNVTAVGANAEVDISNAMVLGSISGVNGATAYTNVGIGITTPQAPLHIDHVPPSVGQDVALITSGGSTNVASLLLQNTHAGGKRLRVGAGTTTTYLASSGGLEFVTNDAGTPNSPFVPAITIDTAGNVSIPGNLSKGGGSFKIDHPLDPASKYLYHSFVESPDMMNIYNGVATLDTRGAVWITLPDYFGALNRDFRYQLTSVGRPQPELYIAKEISGSRFRIAGGKPGGRVSWQVTGIRQDAYANAHRIPVEEEKPAQEQGHYLHPELFGAGPELAIGAPRSASPSTASVSAQPASGAAAR